MGPAVLAALDAVPAEKRNAWRVHRVGGGETLTSIGQRFGASEANIVAANRLESRAVAEGDRLLIPALPRVEAAPRRTVAKAATKGRTTAATTAARRKPAATASRTAYRAPVRKTSAVIARRTAR